ncbi:hypothetical protein Hypma_003120 [Hypsizygus marmoreus]|uniref:Uncharacterized protein n=1 Tax=Hypsizygus marmoreus TaxID=39966 RepID=A0A369J2J6_HYPMA|nr:hypothetical protein Hypma_003120 [Hypsizygus marmoreus]
MPPGRQEPPSFTKTLWVQNIYTVYMRLDAARVVEFRPVLVKVMKRRCNAQVARLGRGSGMLQRIEDEWGDSEVTMVVNGTAREGGDDDDLGGGENFLEERDEMRRYTTDVMVHFPAIVQSPTHASNMQN